MYIILNIHVIFIFELIGSGECGGDLWNNIIQYVINTYTLGIERFIGLKSVHQIKLTFVSRCIVSNIVASVKTDLFIYNYYILSSALRVNMTNHNSTEIKVQNLTWNNLTNQSGLKRL